MGNKGPKVIVYGDDECPSCGMPFEINLNNDQMNQHIDACLEDPEAWQKKQVNL
jgi:hypothetical protein